MAEWSAEQPMTRREHRSRLIASQHLLGAPADATKHRHPENDALGSGSPVGRWTTPVLIGSPVIRIPAKAFVFSADSNSNRRETRFLRPAFFSGPRCLDPACGHSGSFHRDRHAISERRTSKM